MWSHHFKISHKVVISALLRSPKRGLNHQNQNVFHVNQIVPDVVDVAPTKKIDLKYLKPNKVVDLGNELTPPDTLEAPQVHYEADLGSYYTLMMVDPDAPSRKMPMLGEWQHWLVVNIPGAEVENGETLRIYSKVGPPRFTGLHRYVFLVFKQPEKMTFNEGHSSDTFIFRARFSTKNFAKKYNLGDPVAGNFFQARH